MPTSLLDFDRVNVFVNIAQVPNLIWTLTFRTHDGSLFWDKMRVTSQKYYWSGKGSVGSVCLKTTPHKGRELIYNLRFSFL